MQVKMHFICPELFKLLPDGPYEIPDGSTVQSCVECCAAAGGVTLPENWSDQVIFLQDYNPALRRDAASEGVEIVVLRRILGG